MARVWRFDQQIFWRNFREYTAGLVLMVVFAGQIALNNDPFGGAIGLACVGFVMTFLWWKHRHLEPLDPAADLRVYRRALLQRFDDQIRLAAGRAVLVPVAAVRTAAVERRLAMASGRVDGPRPAGGPRSPSSHFIGWLNVQVRGPARGARSRSRRWPRKSP